MALIILQPGATSSRSIGSGSDTDNVFGTESGNETVRIDGDGVVVLDPSFNEGGDVVEIDGLASDYSGTVVGSNLVLTNDTGANITIPVGPVGAQIVFNDVEYTLVIEDGELLLGDQVFPTDGSTVVVDGPDANTAPAFTADEVDIEVDEDGSFSDTLVGTAVDAEGDDLTFSLGEGALNGTVVVNADGTYTYTPNAGFTGSDSYTVIVSDGELTDELTVNVTVVEGDGGVEGTTQSLTFTQDTIDGTAGDDTFRARIVQNNDGFQTNSLGSGDFIDGGAGNDFLDAWVQDASPLGAGPSAAILPETTDVEVAYFRALSVGNTLGGIDVSDLPVLFEDFLGDFGLLDCDFTGPRIGVEINASDMFGLEEVGSNRSDDSLTIYNLTTLASDGETVRNTGDIKVTMAFTGNNNAIDPESDFTVLFDRDYLVCDELPNEGTGLEFEVMDLDAAILLQSGVVSVGERYPSTFESFDSDVTNNNTVDGPLDEIPYEFLNFEVGGIPFTVDLKNDDGSFPVDYDELLANIQRDLAILNTTFGTNVVAQFNGTFIADDPDTNPGGSAQGQKILLRSLPNAEGDAPDITDATFDATRTVPGDKDFQLEVRPFTGPEPEDCKIEVDVMLQKVGRGGDGGELTIGGMTPNLDNVFDEESLSGLPELPRGIEQFNVTVMGDADQPSSLAALRSTDNTLQCVIIADEGDSEATLTIGNRNTSLVDGFDPSFGTGIDGEVNLAGEEECGWACDLSSAKNNALKDVLVFDASQFDNDTEVHGFFSNEVTAKYLTLTDTDSDATADDQIAMYTFGAGDNILNLNIDKTNLAVEGSITRGDFSFFTDTGAGDDTVLIQIGDGEAELFDEGFDGGNWYTNHLLNDNLTIRTDDGDDFIHVFGSSAARINAGDGADVIFTDNSGGIDSARFGNDYNCCRATWVFNARNDDINDLESQNAASIANAANLSVQVQYMDFVVTAEIPETQGSINGVTVTDLMINQAIKAAINDHPVLGDFLVAEDGPGRTLVVRSLVDGEVETTDLTVALVSTGPLSTDQAAGTSLTVGTGPNTFTAVQLAALGFDVDGTPLNDGEDLDGIDLDDFTISGAGRYDADFARDGGKVLDGVDSDNINNNRVEGGLGNDEIALSSSENSIEHLIISGVFSSLSQPGNGDHVLNFRAGAEVATTAAIAEVQTLDFDVDDGDDTNDPLLDETQQDATVTVVIDDGMGGTNTYFVDVPAGSTADEVAALVAAEISTDPNVTATASIDGSGVVTLTYTPGQNFDQATADITSTDPTEEQLVTVTGVQTDAENVTINFAGETFVVPILAGSTAGSVESQIVTFIQNNSSANVSATIDNDTDVDDGGDALLDGQFTLQYFGDMDIGLATVTVSNNNPGANATFAVTQQAGDDFVAFDSGLTVTEDTTTQGVPEGTAIGDYDIIDLSAIIGSGGPQFFENQAITYGDGFGTGEDDAAEGTTSEEYQVINRLIDSNANGVVLVDTINGDPAVSELAELQALVTAADNGPNAPGGTTDTSVIITVQNNAFDDDGVYGDFYQVVDGAAAGDATVTYLGRLYLGGSDVAGKEDIGNFEELTAINFTPLSPSQIIDSFGAVI